ncbi:MAG: hypothetical protein J7J75_00560, partial [Euryarchaeota archaeon]|nr:hypothetical protein [Euryarchaeota archaeon]
IGDRHIIMRITPAIFKDCGKQKISNFTLFTIYETALKPPRHWRGVNPLEPSPFRAGDQLRRTL